MSGLHYGLEGKVALITGASVGLGEQFAHGFAASGANVILTARRRDELERVASDVRAATGVRVLVLPADIADEGEVVQLVADAAAEMGTIDILVNNAGTLVNKPLVEQTIDDWHHVMNVNVTSAFVTSREVARHMIARGSGSIINISSIFAFGATSEFLEVGYYASKGALESMTRALAVELAPNGIRVNSIVPGFFPTPMGSGITTEVRERLIEPRQLLGSRPSLEWIRGAACWLASDDACFVTGTALKVDGGWSAL